MATVVMGDTCLTGIRTTIKLLHTLEIVLNCLRLFVVVGDGSDGRHVCTKYHGHTHYYQATHHIAP